MLGAIQHNGMNNSYTEFGKEESHMPSDVWSDTVCQIARCQSEHPVWRFCRRAGLKHLNTS